MATYPTAEHRDVLLTILERTERSFRARFPDGSEEWIANTDVHGDEREYLEIVADGEAISLLVRTAKLEEIGQG